MYVSRLQRHPGTKLLFTNSMNEAKDREWSPRTGASPVNSAGLKRQEPRGLYVVQSCYDVALHRAYKEHPVPDTLPPTHTPG